ncbi:hypothetical protein [Halobacillus amylolyticus]|uniref:Uncharacterized protein n=1 Tax=Halobacillus amylolyticus TaxID=2932259 RepID=A0ABY4HIN3_9BACI|nr:hypothetical protein [Halobacillus amylolyticus]UOR14193.1 hypothetical protein MUO15_21155 [Halobacillus amylolyticus]
MQQQNDFYYESLFERYTELRKDLHRCTKKLDVAHSEDIALYQEVCMLLAQQINNLRSTCYEVYSKEDCQENLDKVK